MSRLQKVGATVLAAAAALGTLQGGFGVLTDIRDWIAKRGEQPTEFDRTPNAGLEFWQAGTLASMGYFDEPRRIVRVRLHRGAFVLRAPKVPRGTAIEICAWTDPSLLTVDAATNVRADSVECLQLGRGIADPDYASGRLYLDREAKNYLIDTRLRRRGDQDEAFFSTLSQRGKPERRLTKQKDPLYLLVYIDRDKDRRIDHAEYEAVRLEF